MATILSATLLVLLAPIVAAAQPARTIVAYNTASADSQAVAGYYIATRGIPKTNRCPLKVPAENNGYIDYAGYQNTIKAPVQACVTAVGKSSVSAIVLVMLPFKMYDRPHFGASFNGNVIRAVDSQLADLWSAPSEDPIRIANPYFSNGPFVRYDTYQQSVSSGQRLIYPVFHLDGATPAIVRAQIDSAMFAEANGLKGVGCFDAQRVPTTNAGTDWANGSIIAAERLFRATGLQTILDTNEQEIGVAPAPPLCDRAVFYAGMYFGGPYATSIKWAPGGIGMHTDSGSLLNPRTPDSFGGIAIAHGVTVTTGSVDEPYVDALARPDCVVAALIAGGAVGESMYRCTAYLNWMIGFVGDPLYRPFGRTAKPVPGKSEKGRRGGRLVG
jgi:uncharacterized protein (TIGR03790 family)